MRDKNPQISRGIECKFNRRTVLKAAGFATVGGLGGLGVAPAAATTVLDKNTESFEDADVGDSKPADPWSIQSRAGLTEITTQFATDGNQTFYMDGDDTLGETIVAVPIDFSNIETVLSDIYIRRGNPNFGDLAFSINDKGNKIIGFNSRYPSDTTSNTRLTDVNADVSDISGVQTFLIRVRGDNRAFFDNIRFERENIEVTIDIKPCSDPNAINPNDKGLIPVAIKQTDEFNPVERVDVDSLRFGAPNVVENGGGATPEHTGHAEDTVPCEGDGRDDLVLHFSIEDTGFDGDEDTGRLEGETNDGTPLLATDSVQLVGQ